MGVPPEKIFLEGIRWDFRSRSYLFIILFAIRNCSAVVFHFEAWYLLYVASLDNFKECSYYMVIMTTSYTHPERLIFIVVSFLLY